MMIINSLIILSIVMRAVTADIPGCDYFHTVDLQSSQRLKNGSYLYKDVLIPIEKIGTYNYRITLRGTEKQVASYPRGCLCHVKFCVPFCCDPGIHKYAINITFDNGEEKEFNVGDEIAVQVRFELSCDLLEDMAVDEQTQDEWKIFENGSLLNLTANSEVERKDYCLMPQKDEDENYKLVPHIQQEIQTKANTKLRNISDENCKPQQVQQETQTKTKLDVISGIKIVSVFCMLITIAVYLYLPQFHTIYNKCCLCYFICLTTSFLLLWAEDLFREEIPSKLVCFVIGYCGYYTVMGVFLWLFVINYHLWKTFKNFGIMYKTSMQRYHIFVWSAAAVLLAITGSVEYALEPESYWKPGVGLYYCWINTLSWSAMIYYYGPMLVGILINLTLSVITARHIYVENRENSRQWTSSESQMNLSNQAELSMFFRLFAIAGVIWLLELFSYWFEIDIETITFVFDIITSGQGILLFFVTIWKKDVLKSLYERMETKVDKPSEQSLSSIT